jgi:hypothetical protein
VVTLPTLPQALEDFFETLLSQYSVAFSSWWEDVKASMQAVIDAMPNPILTYQQFSRHLLFLVARFEKLLQDLLTAPRAAVLNTALKLALSATPKPWSYQVVKRDQAFKDCCTAIVTGVLDGGSVGLPIPARLANFIVSIKTTLRLVKAPGTPVGLLLKLTVGTILTIILRLLDILLTFITVVAAIVAVWSLWLFVKGMGSTPSKYLKPLQQATKRKKWYAVKSLSDDTVTVIRRRDPGGNPP